MPMKKIFTLCFLVLLATAALAQDGARKYSIKSGIATLITTTGDTQSESTQYFDNYGAQECLKQHMEMPGLVSYDYYTITKGDKAWFVTDVDGKKSSKGFDNPTPDLNFLNPTDEIKAKYNIQELGTDTFLGKKCTKYSYETIQKRKTVSWTVWVYNGFVLKSITKMGKRENVIEVTKLQENVAVPAGIFDIP